MHTGNIILIILDEINSCNSLLQRSGGGGGGLDELTVYSVFSEISRAVGHMHSQSPPMAHR